VPDLLKLDSALCTRKAVKKLVEKAFEVMLAINAVGDYLRIWGFTAQKSSK